MARILIGLFLGVLIAAGAMYATRKDRESSLEATAPLQTDIATLQPESRLASDDVTLEPPQTDASAGSEATPLPTFEDAGHSGIRPEFNALFDRNPAIAAQYQAFEKEPRDPAWASSLEAALQQVISSNPAVTRFGQPEIECRSTRCVVRLLAYGASDVPLGDWPQLLSVKGAFFDANDHRIPHAPNPPSNMNIDVIESGGASALLMTLLFPRTGF